MAENYDIPAPKKHMLSMQIDPALFEKATDEEKKQADVMAESTTFFKDGMRRLMRNPLAVFSMVVLALVLALIIVTPRVVPYSYEQIITVDGKRDKQANNLKPFQYSPIEKQYMEKTNTKLFPHIMGTDELGRDYFIRVIYGTRVSVLVGVFASLMVLVIGTVYGSIAGYMGGKIDLAMMRIVDIIYSLPDLLIIILLSVVFKEKFDFSKIPIIGGLGTNMVSMFIVFGLLYWVGMSRLVRGQILTIKENDWCKCRTYYQKTYFAKLHQCHYYQYSTANPICYFYRVLSFLYWTGCCSSYAFFGISCQCSEIRYAILSVKIGISSSND